MPRRHSATGSLREKQRSADGVNRQESPKDIGESFEPAGRLSRMSALGDAAPESSAAKAVAGAADLRVRYVNQALCRLLDTSADELLGCLLIEVIGRAGNADALAALERVALGITDVEQIDVSDVIDGPSTYVASVSGIADSTGPRSHVVARIYEVRGGKLESFEGTRIEELRQKALSQALSASRVGSWAWDFATGLGTWDPDLYRIFDRPPASELFTYETFLEVIHPDDRGAFREAARSALEGRGAFSADFRGLLPDGTSRWFSARGFVHKRDGVTVGMTGTIQDVDDRRRAENALVESQSLLGDVLYNTPAPIFMKERDGKYLYVNKAWLEASGLTREETLEHTDDELFEPEIAADFRRNDALAMISRDAIHRQEIVWSADKTEHIFSVVKFPVLNGEGEVVGVCGVGVDTTDARRAAAARFEERERIAAEIHDDSVQVMAAVALRLDSLERVAQDDEVRGKISSLRETVRASIDRLRKTMFELQNPLPEGSPLARAMEDFLERSRSEHGLEFTFTDLLEGEPDRLLGATLFRIGREALVNVVKHASASRVRVELSRADGGVRLLISDDGVGFDGHESPEGHLGLSSMRSRAQRVGGRCDVESEPGKGTTVDVWLPEPLRDPLHSFA